jgi:hypothetical protein
VRLERADRRRLALASALTAVALPAVWLVNRDDEQASSNRPNVAAVGLDPGEAPPRTGATRGGQPTETTEADPMGELEPLFLDEEPAAPAPEHVSVAVGEGDHALLTTGVATYSRSVASGEGCPYNGVASGTRVMVLNPANGRSIECVTSPSDGDELVLHPDQFALLAGLDTAPVPVEIYQ